jgi:hypothetical protein
MTPEYDTVFESFRTGCLQSVCVAFCDADEESV